MTLTKKSEFGDFQTPSFFCDKVVDLLSSKYKLNPSYLIEPTIGKGNFIFAALKKFKSIKEIFGIDLNRKHIEELKRKKINNLFLKIENAFDYKFKKLDFYKKEGQLLCLGNPPWVTNSFLSSHNSDNLPQKNNKVKHADGFSAISGSSNFDIAECVLLNLINQLKERKETYFSFLVKSIVARNIYRYLWSSGLSLSLFDVYHFDSKKVFAVSCDASLVVFKLKEKNEKEIDYAREFSFEKPQKMKRRFGYVHGLFVSDIDTFNKTSFLERHSQRTWRQGIKHDCSKVMELSMKEGRFFNNKGAECDALKENERIFPLVKSSDLKGGIIKKTSHFLIVTQDRINQDTSFLKKDKMLWDYLIENKSDFDKRKSVIYQNRPLFSIFGVGEYSFTKYKIAVSGFYKDPHFTFLDGEKKPIMADDTCYFIGTDDRLSAQLLFCALDSPIVYSFLASISFKDSKRPITKSVLQKIDLIEAIKRNGYDSLADKMKKAFAVDLELKDFISIIEKLRKHEC